MKRTHFQSLATIVLLVGAQQAFAAGPASGTAADTTITNTASVSYEVGGVTQTAPGPGTATFEVDRLINVTVDEVSTTYTTVTPGQTAQAVTFTVTNNTNDTMDYGLDAANAADPFGGTDSFDPGAYTYYLDDGDNIFNSADTLLTVAYLDEMAPDEIRTVHVVSDIPLTAVDGDIAGVSLQATARDGGVGSTQGAVSTALDNTQANTLGVDNVFGDVAGTANNDVAGDGKHSDSDAYLVAAATITVTKSSTVISDPVNNTSNPKAIPGAVIEYCISVINASISTAASNVVVSDGIPVNTTYVAGSIFTGGSSCASGSGTSVTDAVDAEGPPSGDYSASAVHATVPSVPASSTVTTIFRVTID